MSNLVGDNVDRPRGTWQTRDTTIFGRRLDGLGWSKTGTLITGALLILIGVLWLATRPYQGVVNDARLYMVQALRELYPARFDSDLYFRFGSQDEFTIFSRAYAPLLSMLGVGTTGIVLTLAGHVVWICGLVYLARGLIRDRWQSLLSVAAAIALPSAYAIWYTGYGEPFVTPRSFAEALTLIALGLLLRCHAGWALAVLAISATIHPLMTLPGLAFVFIYLALGRPLWWLAIFGGALTLIVLAAAGVQPFVNLRVTFDPVWLEIVQVRDGMCFVTRWPSDTCFRTLGTAALGVLAVMAAEPRERRFLGAALVIGIGGVVCTFVGADLAHNVFMAEIQPYRSMWILTLVANLCVVPIFLQLLRWGDAADLTRLGFLAAMSALLLSRYIPIAVYIALPMLAFTIICAGWHLAAGRALPFLVRIFYLLIIAVAGTAIMIFTYYPFKLLKEFWPAEFDSRIYSFALVIAVAALLSIYITKAGQEGRLFPRLFPWLAAALLPIALLGWDARTPWTKLVESTAPVPASLADLLPQDASVYWEGGVEMLWLRLKRNSYFSCTQGTGAVFFRGTAVAYRHRAESLWPLRTIDFEENIYCPALQDADTASRTREGLAEVCGREPELDYLVLTEPVANAEAKVWNSPVPFRNLRVVNGKPAVAETDRFYIYSCAGLR
jgi:hypothetical protein